MSVHILVLLMLALGVGLALALFAGGIAFGVARWGGAPVPEAINRGSFVAFSAMVLFLTLLAIIATLVT
ncbi:MULTISPECIES: hypothetical protein [Streptomyces]|uniref:Uncharacterized protein n=2 Tax=Streptomyces TaxID=1883 RepID=A0ABV9J855_9ACTN